jgi:hypothetical protein
MVAGPIYRTGQVTEATAFAATSAVIDEIKDAALDSEWWTSADDFTDSGNRYLVLENTTNNWFYVVRAFASGNIQWSAGEEYNSTTKVMAGYFMGNTAGHNNNSGNFTLDSSGRIAGALTNTGVWTNTGSYQPSPVSPWPSTPDGTIKYAISVTQHMIATVCGSARWMTQLLESTRYSSTVDPVPVVGIGVSTRFGYIVRAPGYSGSVGHNSNIGASLNAPAANMLAPLPPLRSITSNATWPASDYVSGKTTAARIMVVPQPNLSLGAASTRGPRGLLRSAVGTAVPPSQAPGDTIVINGNRWMWSGNFIQSVHSLDEATLALWVDTGTSATPSAPIDLTATAGDTEVELDWTVPASDGGSAITDYTVEYRTTSGPGEWTEFTDGTSTTTSATVTGLTNDTEYDFRVRAVNVHGSGVWSSTVSATPTAP